MIKFILFFLLSFPLLASTLSLYDLSFLVSKKSGKSVIFSKNVNQNIKIIVGSAPVDYLPLFKQALASNGYSITSNKTFYFVTVPNVDKKDEGILSSLSFSSPSSASNGASNTSLMLPPPPLANDSVGSSASGGISVTSGGKQIFSSPMFDSKGSSSSNFDNNVSSTFKTLFLVYLNPYDLNATLQLSGFEYSISKATKAIIFKVPDNKIKLYDNLVTAIKSIDLPPNQLTLKITVFSTEAKKLHDLGFSSSLNLDTNISFTSPNILVGSLISQFYSSLHLLDSKGAVKVTDNPVFLVSDNETLDFKSVINIAFLDQNVNVTSQTGTNQTSAFTYKPIGFKVLITPTIVNDVVYLDFYMSFEDILTAGDRPTTSEKSIKNKFSLKKGELVLLAGISKNKSLDNKESLPFLSDLPYVGGLFSHKTKSNNDEFFNISIEVVK